jgi:ribosomal protein
MINLKVFQQEDGKISGFSMSGHSGTAKRGEDIVCAGVSSLSQAALLGIYEYLHRDMDYQHASGKLEMKLKGAPDDLTEAILRTMLLGLREIEKLSPKAFHIEIQR